MRTWVRRLGRQDGGIALYVAEAMLLVAVFLAGVVIISATTQLGEFFRSIISRVVNWQ